MSSTPSNPFSAARLRPGTIDFIFEHGQSLEQLVDLLEANHWRGEITGKHGTGKSTLLAAMIPAIEGRGRIVKRVTLSAGQRKLPRGYLTSLRLTAGLGVAAVDGIEQLSALGRLRLKRCCRIYAVGLLAASHRSAKLPRIYQTAIEVPRAWKVVQRFQEGYPSLVKLGDLVDALPSGRAISARPSSTCTIFTKSGGGDRTDRSPKRKRVADSLLACAGSRGTGLKTGHLWGLKTRHL